MKNLLKESKGLCRELLSYRRALHENAETGFALNKTLSIVRAALEGMGYTPKACGRSGLVATVGRGEKTFLLRADMDGLPIVERSGEKFSAVNGNMHACGHDMHTAMLLGAAKLLKAHEEGLAGEVKLLFQPAEELLEGAREMLAAGVLENPKPSGAMTVHVMTAVELPVGAVVVADGTSAPAADFFTIKTQGRGCHGSAPWNGVDALSATARIAVGLEEISARELSLAQPAVLTTGLLRAGDAGNVLANEGILQGTLRAFDEDTRARVKKRVSEVAKGIGKAFRVGVKVTFGGGCPTLVNDARLTALAEDTAKELLGEERTVRASAIEGNVKRDNGGSEDFAYISHALPSVMLAIAAGEKKAGYEYPLHHPKVRFDEGALPVGAAMYAAVAMRFLKGE